MLHHNIISTKWIFADQRLAAALSRSIARSLPIAATSDAMSGPLSRPVKARRSGRNKALPFAPVAALS